METWRIIVETIVVLGAILIGVRVGGVGIGLWGGVGVAILVFVFGERLGTPPIDALLIIVAVILATSTLQASGGIDWMVWIAAKPIVRRPKSVTVIAPLVSLLAAIGAGTSNILFALLPVIQEVSERAGVRASKPVSTSVVATSIALACSPVSAAMAAMIAIQDAQGGNGWSVLQLMAVTVPAAVIDVVITGVLVSRFGGVDPRDLAAQRGLAPDAGSGPIELDSLQSLQRPTARGRATALIYFAGVLAIVAFGLFPALRPSNVAGDTVNVATMIQLIMLVTATLVVMVGPPTSTPCPPCRSSEAAWSQRSRSMASPG